jgi:hypothetical protein
MYCATPAVSLNAACAYARAGPTHDERRRAIKSRNPKSSTPQQSYIVILQRAVAPGRACERVAYIGGSAPVHRDQHHGRCTTSPTQRCDLDRACQLLVVVYRALEEPRLLRARDRRGELRQVAARVASMGLHHRGAVLRAGVVQGDRQPRQQPEQRYRCL